MDDTHDKLVKAYLKYFEASEWWERKHSTRAYQAVQQATKEIMKLAKARNTEIRLENKAISEARKKDSE